MIVLQVQVAKTSLEKLRGLLGKPNGTSLLLKTRFGVHTFFMKYPIDILVLDDNNRVKILKNNLKPNRLFFWNPKFQNLLELPNGFIAQKNIKVDEKISLQNIP